MIKIALFCEGVSENRMLTYITERYLGDVIVDGIYPDVKDIHGHLSQNGFGGWKSVLDHCNDSDFDSALDGHDYLIIQIDTDTCSQTHYDVETAENGNPLDDEIIFERVKKRLLRDISQEKRELYASKIIFAICFNETECWLLPLFYERDRKKCEKTNNCIFTLNQSLTHSGMGIPYNDKNSPNAIKVYDKVLKGFKAKNIPKFSQYNCGFKHFIEQLDSIKSV